MSLVICLLKQGAVPAGVFAEGHGQAGNGIYQNISFHLLVLDGETGFAPIGACLSPAPGAAVSGDPKEGASGVFVLDFYVIQLMVQSVLVT